jgi:Putative collagen-binding domain of a collagenase
MSGISDKDFARRMVWWALSSGSKGFNLGDNEMWTWDSSALGEIATNTFYTRQVPAIMSYWRSLPDWQRLVADTSSQLVTGGRGLHIAPIPSGGSGTALSDNSDSYVTASRTPDGTLAVIYLSHHSAIRIDESELKQDYKATWVDPASGATRAVTPGPTYDSSSQGSNSVGGADWVLVLRAPASSSNRVKREGTAHLAPRSWAKGAARARLHARFAMTYACSACGRPERPIRIQGRLHNGTWRTIVTRTYHRAERLTVRVPYKYRRLRVVAPELSTNAHTTWAKVVSNSVRVPRKPR